MNTRSLNSTKARLIAPCGIDCRLCRAYGRERNACPGCRAGEHFKYTRAVQCSVHCEKLAAGAFQYCFECDEFPCKTLLHLDKRYRTRYATSPIENLRHIQANGIRQFVRDENLKWACPQCGTMLCMHHPECVKCGYQWHAACDE